MMMLIMGWDERLEKCGASRTDETEGGGGVLSGFMGLRRGGGGGGGFSGQVMTGREGWTNSTNEPTPRSITACKLKYFTNKLCK